MKKYKFYMQKMVWSDEENEYVPDGKEYNLEEDFSGLKYSKCEGLNAIGEHRVYTEEYADSDRKRVYMSDSPTHKSTEVKLTLYFIGDNRQSTFDSFNEYIMDGFHAYRDTARNKKVVFYVNKPITPSQEMCKGSTHYIEVTYTLSNVYGKAINV